jgi:hypothetical protein
MIKTLSSLILALSIVASSASAQTAVSPTKAITAPTPVPAGAITPPPIPGAPPTPVAPPTALAPPTPALPPSAAPTATAAASVAPAGPTPPSNLVKYVGQLLDYRDNYVYFTSGDAFPAVEAPRIIDYMTSQPTSVRPQAKMFAQATFDPVTKKIIELAITTRRLQTSQSLGPASAFVVVGSTPAPAPEIAGQNLTGKQVAVVFEVTVPPTTTFADQVFISTDSSDWNPTAIKLDRVNAYEYRALRYFASGTKFAYRVTRGSWDSVERGQDNLDSPPHQFFVTEVDSLAARVTVYHWSDERGAAQSVGPASIPTPYNPSPFGGGPGGIAVPQVKIPPTPQPGH